MKLYNTLTRRKEEFQPQEKGKVKMYNCGPTVYDYAHIGNLYAFLFADILRRYLEYQGYEVRQIMNITDVGHLTADDVNQADSGQDKMLKAALREKKTPEEIANFYTEKFFEDLEKLNIKKAAYYPRATAHISQIIKLIEVLLEKGLAYEKNGNVFYDVKKFKDYGKLSGKKIADLKTGARLEEHPDKRHPYDFALWLKAPKNHLMKWESPWSLGYPGWHIECSAMSMEYLGETLDIHTGGEDHIFPHHENEIAQSEGATGKPFSRSWLHVRFLLVNGEKMSKSKGNFYILRDILQKGYSPMDFRLLFLSSHYRASSNFTWRAMDQAHTNLEKIVRFVEELQQVKTPQAAADSSVNLNLFQYQQAFEEALADDLNTPRALAVIFELVTDTNKKLSAGKLSTEEAAAILTLWNKMNSVLGLKLEKTLFDVPDEIKNLLRIREAARQAKDFEKSDTIRKEIEAAGYQVEDTPQGQKVRKMPTKRV